MISLYRPPDTCIENFTEIIEDHLNNNNQQIQVCGDFNIDLININNMIRQIHLSIQYFHWDINHSLLNPL